MRELHDEKSEVAMSGRGRVRIYDGGGKSSEEKQGKLRETRRVGARQRGVKKLDGSARVCITRLFILKIDRLFVTCSRNKVPLSNPREIIWVTKTHRIPLIIFSSGSVSVSMRFFIRIDEEIYMSRDIFNPLQPKR